MKEPDPNKATLAKVLPTPNNGFPELVALQRDQVSLDIYSYDLTFQLYRSMCITHV